MYIYIYRKMTLKKTTIYTTKNGGISRMTSVRVSEEFYIAAKEKGIILSDALRMGLSIMLKSSSLSKAYKQLYDENQKLQSKIMKLQDLLTQALTGSQNE